MSLDPYHTKMLLGCLKKNRYPEFGFQEHKRDIKIKNLYQSYLTLIVRGHLEQRESVLIHTGAGSVGQAAIGIALNMGCTVFTTVGSIDKKNFLKEKFPLLIDNHIGNSRDTSFEHMVKVQTQGRGVDLILNSLSGDQQKASIRCLAKGGRFLEIGSGDLVDNSLLDMNMPLSNTSFLSIFIGDLSSSEKKKLLSLLRDGIVSGFVQPLARTVFTDTEIEQAFRFTAAGSHIGKVVVKIRDERDLLKTNPIKAISRKYMNPSKSYILVGGLSGTGLELCNWLITRGATKIILTSRKGITSGYQSLCLQRWHTQNINVVVSTLDTRNLAMTYELLDKANHLGCVGGIFNLSSVLYDETIENISEADFNSVVEAKATTTKNLDVVSRELTPHLEYFVVFSSVASGRGNVGQTNYGYANSVMEQVMEDRQRKCLPGTAIQWGAIGDVGYIVDNIGTNNRKFGGLLPQRISSCLSELDILLNNQHSVTSCFVLGKDEEYLNDADDRNVLSIVGNIMGIKDISTVGLKTTFVSLGMDSLMAADIKRILGRYCGTRLSTQEIRLLTFEKLGDINKNGSTMPKNITPDTPEAIMPTKVLVQMSNKDSDTQSTKVFATHPIEGDIRSIQVLIDFVSVPMYGLQCTAECPKETINELAKYYITHIESVQKDGPYIIMGYSFGACVALEIGLQLERRGVCVKLVLVEGSHCYVSNGLNAMHVSDATKLNTLLGYFVSRFKNENEAEVLNEIAHLESLDEKITHIANFLTKTVHYKFHEIKAAATMMCTNFFAANAYKPSSILKGDVTLIKAKHNFFSIGDDYGLNSVCERKVKILTLDGNHYTIFKDANTSIIANIIEDMCNNNL